ncbi:MAG TPA: PEGA domain-containing protein, partial [Gemmatimonadales bacterium]|nr:PEGA domain-containing protein [Gemmatimonadales bacterium]
GAIIGTPHYMAPEQAKGLQVDGRADQYSLGIVGYQILTGKQPFDGSSHSILYKHVFEPPPRVFEARPDAPADLVAALDRALSKEPEKRFASMEDFAAAVSGTRARASGPAATVVSAPIKTRGKNSSSAPAKPKRPASARRTLVSLALLTGVGGAAWAGLRALEAPSEPAPAAESAPPVPQPPASRRPRATQPAPSTAVDPPIDRLGSEGTAAPPKPRPVPKQYALLTVASEPWGMLYIDGVEIGPTPVADHRLERGTYRLRIEQEGFRTKTETIVVSGPNPIRRRYSLEPAGP